MIVLDMAMRGKRWTMGLAGFACPPGGEGPERGSAGHGNPDAETLSLRFIPPVATADLKVTFPVSRRSST